MRSMWLINSEATALRATERQSFVLRSDRSTSVKLS